MSPSLLNLSNCFEALPVEASAHPADPPVGPIHTGITSAAACKPKISAWVSALTRASTGFLVDAVTYPPAVVTVPAAAITSEHQLLQPADGSHRRSSGHVQRSSSRATLAMLMTGSCIVHHVAVKGSQTFCSPRACVKDVNSSATQLLKDHHSASVVVVRVGTNDIHHQQSEILREDFICLVDIVLDSGKQLINSGPSLLFW